MNPSNESTSSPTQVTATAMIMMMNQFKLPENYIVQSPTTPNLFNFEKYLTVNCNQHMNEYFVYYCLTCKIMLCQECFKQQQQHHQQHQMQLLSDTLQDTKMQIEALLSESNQIASIFKVQFSLHFGIFFLLI